MGRSGQVVKIKIQWLSDEVDCETCGGNWASGANVYFDDKLVIEMKPVAGCYDGEHYDCEDVLHRILAELGHQVEEIR